MANEFIVRRGIKSLGGITFPQVTINSTYSVTDDDYMVDITGGTFTVSLPTAVGRQGRLFVIKNNGGGAVTVDPYGSETIDGKPFVILGETNSIQLASNGSEWVAMSYNISTVNSSTGVFEFTGMTIASPTTFTVAPVKAWIVDDSTNPLSPQLYYVDYSGGTHTAIYVTASTSSYIYLNSGGTISQQSIPLTEQQRRENIFLGKLGHANKTNIINAFSQPDFVLSPLSQLRDMFTPIPLINGGIYASPNGANLSFNTSAGYLYGLGINFANDTLSPDAIYVTGTAPATFQYRTQTGGTASDVTLIDPTKYDVGGVITSLSGTKATNQRIFLVQNGKFRVQYGQTQYSNLSQAIAGIATETFTTFSNFRDNGILIGVLSVLNSATNLTDTSKAQFFYTSKFGETVGSAGGFSTTNLQQAYNNSIDPEIITNSSLGALTLQRGSASDADDVFQIQDGAGVHRMFVNASGRTTTTDLTITGVTSTSGLTRYLVVDNSGNTYHQTGGDMILGSTQTNSGAKTFLDTTLLLRNAANTFNGSFTNTNTADRIYTLPDTAGTIALTSNLSSYVPYTGATANVSLGANSLFTTTLGVGISSSLSSTAHIRGTSPTTGSVFLVQNSTPANVFNVLNSGFVGVGSNTPISLLHIGTGSGTTLGDLTTPVITFNTVNNGIYLDSNRLFFKAAGAFSFGIDSTGVLGNQFRINSTSPNNLTTPIFIPNRSITTSGFGGNSAGDICLITSGTTRLRVNSNGDLGFFGVTPVSRQTLGAATAGATYTATEQGMLQRVYDALRNYGLGT